jgi:hypothetical protein
MDLGYDGQLYILAFDHRGSFIKRFGIEGDSTFSCDIAHAVSRDIE